MMAALAALTTGSTASAQFVPDSLDRLDLLQREATSSTTVTPIYSQLLLFSLPDEFHTLVSTNNKAHYTQTSVPTGETASRWTQMITVSGDEAMAFSGKTWPQLMVDTFAAKVRKNCPEASSTLPIPNAFVASYDTAIVVAACGSVGGRSEATMQMVIKGGMDVYTIEWTVRGPAVRGPMKLELVQWTDRLRRLGPVKICRIVPGETAPYPSCTRRR